MFNCRRTNYCGYLLLLLLIFNYSELRSENVVWRVLIWRYSDSLGHSALINSGKCFQNTHALEKNVGFLIAGLEFYIHPSPLCFSLLSVLYHQGTRTPPPRLRFCLIFLEILTLFLNQVVVSVARCVQMQGHSGIPALRFSFPCMAFCLEVCLSATNTVIPAFFWFTLDLFPFLYFQPFHFMLYVGYLLIA